MNSHYAKLNVVGCVEHIECDCGVYMDDCISYSCSHSDSALISWR